jgi:hypothetical protein
MSRPIEKKYLLEKEKTVKYMILKEKYLILALFK